MSLKADIRWTQGLSDKQRENLVAQLVGSMSTLNSLREHIVALDKEKGVLKEVDYNNPSWPYWRADRDGYSKGLRDVLKLIPSIEKE